MNLIGYKLKKLRIQKGLTQEELGERTDLSKGYISQVERDLASPSMETFFNILQVLGCEPKDFFEQKSSQQQILYKKEDQTSYEETDDFYKLNWLVPESNEKEMESLVLTLKSNSKYKKFDPSESDTLCYVLKGKCMLTFGSNNYVAETTETFYFTATDEHVLSNPFDEECEVLIVVTNSYL
ncbi:helix-turn-helix transcriptional regulator [Gemella sp. GH3]|uniref:helix-turn-helix domain-containing protein n=1 Tax=unclassified Gemella TaxID=2624949 RepID=UPI0015CFFAE4|nr:MULTISPECIES: XRE family transcriptional regulator [unclassified Gemella]MBF0714406.1 helix-turn-helix transcriptional regulator [Gemella sp. GH3.1]NYS51358.1 helix-turn-helix transcriptional regulator [Gemella sp. GH3]